MPLLFLLTLLVTLPSLYVLSALARSRLSFTHTVRLLLAAVTVNLALLPLIAANPRHRIARDAWLALYLFVAIQMAWVLRPFVGDPDQPTRFFRAGAWSNAYVEIAQLIWRVVGS